VKKGFLVLETGHTFEGRLLNDNRAKAGEVVFNTSHSGYEQISSDPSYFQQIMVMTAPMQGNYGVTETNWESKKYWINGFVCLQMQDTAGNRAFLADLAKQEIPVLDQVYTRELVLLLRRQGTVRGAIVPAETRDQALAAWEQLKSQVPDGSDWPFLVSRKNRESIQGRNPNGPRVAVMDFGCKENILRCVQKRASQVEIFNSRATAQEILDWKPDGVLLSNGPGDPESVEKSVETIATLLGKKPMFGICMGHQLLARAFGAKTYKLRFGHRGANHPVQDKILNQIYVTSQNHGYAVDDKTLPDFVEVTHLNLNDHTVEGIRSQQHQCMSVQFHPESHPGPNDAEILFDEFTRMMR
jgi:carbamoyl-phosphate synthase small subunit